MKSRVSVKSMTFKSRANQKLCLGGEASPVNSHSWAGVAFALILTACASAPPTGTTDSSQPAAISAPESAAMATPTATPVANPPENSAYAGGNPDDFSAPTQHVHAASGVTADDAIPDFKDATFISRPLIGIRPRTVEISVDTSRSLSRYAGNKAQILEAVREGLQKALARCNVAVVPSAQNKMNFEIKDCRNAGDSAECVQIDAILRTPKFELEVGGYSHNGYTAPGSKEPSQIRGDISRAYIGAIQAVLDRLNKQLEIIRLYQ